MTQNGEFRRQHFSERDGEREREGKGERENKGGVDKYYMTEIHVFINMHACFNDLEPYKSGFAFEDDVP